jgi:hypothetical protein
LAQVEWSRLRSQGFEDDVHPMRLEAAAGGPDMNIRRGITRVRLMRP